MIFQIFLLMGVGMDFCYKCVKVLVVLPEYPSFLRNPKGQKREKKNCDKFESLRSFLSVKPASALPFPKWL